jgi:hypothetical protein
MRIACIHIPQFALQCATRLDPSLRGAPVAVVSTVEPGRERSRPGDRILGAPIVLACSRAAWSLGVRLGMTATAARGLSPALRVVTAEPALERDAVRAIADSALALTPTVDVGGRVGAGGAHLAMYTEVPAKTRGTSFGDRLVELLEDLGFAARIGIADDRFTAWVAAAHSSSSSSSSSDAPGEHAVTSVPRGGSAAFLAPRPLSLLAITPEVQHMLEALGVRTLGEFAALPAPSVSVHRPFEADYQALARGESGTQLRPYTPDAPIREDIVVSAGNVLERDGFIGGPAAVALVAHRLAHRLAGRGRAAARLDVTIDRNGTVSELPITLGDPALTAEELARDLAPVLDQPTPAAPESASWRLRVLVSGEALLGAAGAVSAVVAEGTSPFARVASTPNASANDNAADSIYERSSEGVTLRDLTQREEPRAAASDESLSPLAMVLASTGSLFALSPPAQSTSSQARSERRDAHRRTQRGKQRRARSVTGPVQPRLFDRTSLK